MNRSRTNRVRAIDNGSTLLPAAIAAAFLILVALILVAAPSAADVDSDNDARLGAIVPTIVLHDVAIPIGLIPEPTVSIPAEVAEAALNLALKGLPPVFEAPPDLGILYPNTLDQCAFKFVMPQARTELSNILGIITIRKPIGKWRGLEDPLAVDIAEVERIEACLNEEVTGPVRSFFNSNMGFAVRRRCELPDNNWGILGPPTRAWHANTDVSVTVDSITAGIAGVEFPQIVELPAGDHSMSWTAETQLGVIGDILIPSILIPVMAYTEALMARYAPDIVDALSADKLAAEAIEESGEQLGRALAANAWKIKVGEFLIDKVGPEAAELFVDPIVTARSIDGQYVGVYDVFPPTIEASTNSLIFEASDFGGTRTSRHKAVIDGTLTITDACGREPLLISDLPPFLPLGDTVVTWRVEDRGPNDPADPRDFFAEVEQTISVLDRQKPLVLAPPSKVLETLAAEIDQAAAEIGFAVAIDLADPQPAIVNDAPDTFTRDTRTEITWTATDASGNFRQKSQWVTVKTEGTNTTPVAEPANAETLTAEPIPIVLRATDADMLDGRVDPVWFEIEDQPTNGEFVAPLYPFFIDDFRTNPADDVAPGFAAAPSKTTWVDDNYCSLGSEPPRDFVYEPSFVHVTDDGDRFMIDKYFWCNDPVEISRRISWWDADDKLLGQHVPGIDSLANDNLVVDRDGFLYYFSLSGGGTSSGVLNLTRCGLQRDAETGSFNCLFAGSFGNGGEEGIDRNDLSYARVDSQLGVVYYTDRKRVYVALLGGGYLGILNPVRDADGFLVDLLGGRCSIPRIGSNGAYGMEVDSQGALYVADSCGHRIHKFAASSFDATGAFVPGDYIGWAGRCTDSNNNACDVGKQRSRGYSCTDETCTLGPDPGPIPFEDQAGDLQGQFYHPLFLALDPNDVLYVADYSNFRVQRFAPDGTFAGEAVSEGTGVNKGEHPSFVLGNMDRPRAVSVNSTRFYVVDYDERFVHIFGTLPFTDITENSATVTYVSNQDFHGADDHFTFSVDDGLAKSVPADVTISVARNFRPPVAVAAELETDEEMDLAITLEADDPDGELGIDFNGLDTFTYRLESFPEHGELIGDGADWVYTPDPGFDGEDGFFFSVDDGLFAAPAAWVSITVLPINDPPIVTLQLPDRVGIGFPIVVVASLEDEMSTSYEAEVIWGDGAMIPETLGDVQEDDGSGNPGLVGISLLNPSVEGAAPILTGIHTYHDLGTYLLFFCASDDEAEQGCAGAPINVEPLVNLGLAAEASLSSVNDGVAFTYTIEVKNGVPDAAAAFYQAANLVEVRAQLPPELLLSSAVASVGSCNVNGSLVTCPIGTLANGASATVTLTVAGRGNLIYDVRPEIMVDADTASDSVAAIYESLGVNEIIADPTDSDGDGLPDVFEVLFELSTSVNDAAGDADIDGLDNLGEFESRTDPQASDSDGDGLTDGAEVNEHFTDPNAVDSDGDGMPDGYEVTNGLNPLIDDADLDLDNDGLSNLAEYEQGSNPTAGDRDADGVLDSVDNCHLPNPGQEDANGNGIGDPCDCRPTPQPECVNPEPIYASVALAGEFANFADDNGLGAVDYEYDIATTEVTNAAYLDFLNAVAGTGDPNGLYNDAMGIDAEGGIEQFGMPGAYGYRLRPNRANKPVNFVSWLDAARYVNWLENGKPMGLASNSTTEQGAFDLTVSNPGLMATTEADASWSLPTEDEWYKAAYYDPNPPARYSLYPTSSNIEPRPMQSDGLGNGVSGDVNYWDGPGGTNLEPLGVLSVASGEAGNESAYGTRDQGGNVTEWLASDVEEGQRIVRGGGFRDGSSSLLSFPSPERSSQLFDANHEADDIGIRVVHLIPEPSRWLLQCVALGVVALVADRKNKQRFPYRR